MLYYFQSNEISWSGGRSGGNSREEQWGWRVSTTRVPCARGSTNPNHKPAALGDALEAQCGQANWGSVLAAAAGPTGAWMEVWQQDPSGSRCRRLWAASSSLVLLRSSGNPQSPTPLPAPSLVHSPPCSPPWHLEQSMSAHTRPIHPSSTVIAVPIGTLVTYSPTAFSDLFI